MTAQDRERWHTWDVALRAGPGVLNYDDVRYEGPWIRCFRDGDFVAAYPASGVTSVRRREPEKREDAAGE